MTNPCRPWLAASKQCIQSYGGISRDERWWFARVKFFNQDELQRRMADSGGTIPSAATAPSASTTAAAFPDDGVSGAPGPADDNPFTVFVATTTTSPHPRAGTILRSGWDRYRASAAASSLRLATPGDSHFLLFTWLLVVSVRREGFLIFSMLASDVPSLVYELLSY